MLVAVPPPVAAMVSDWPARPSPVVLRPSLASPEPESVRPRDDGVKVIAPPDTLPVTPVAEAIVDSRSLTESPIPIVVPVEVVPAMKLKVVPFTTIVSEVAKLETRSWEEVPAVPDSLVLPASAAAVAVLSSVRALPVTLDVVKFNRLVAVAPVIVFEVTLDFVV